MSNIDKQALRADALEATGGSWVRESGEGWEAICCDDDQGNAGFIIAEFQGENATANRKFVQSANPATVLALLDELEAKDKRIAELEAREINLPPYSFFDFKQGSPFKSGAYCHIDSVNQELSKHGIKMTAAAGKGE
ncbi:TPA: ead/Ea22-like family protein [Enterobacter hormaechei subsp. xiangfangensis]|uniref:ead/Ea22-like family protein n=2 Tax=Enterobacter TaxID=547 RepID=UPI001C1B64E9|nr:ead/Ea22-like family protein [Enterobacter hormaechei subsp. xiangfangensis]HBM7593148.1 ead/Ea22-like family protein [Enterobacter hormaechei subsp. xiangfangensis]